MCSESTHTNVPRVTNFCLWVTGNTCFFVVCFNIRHLGLQGYEPLDLLFLRLLPCSLRLYKITQWCNFTQSTSNCNQSNNSQKLHNHKNHSISIK